MTTPDEIATALLERVLAAPQNGRRKTVALAGPPASGKTTLAKVLGEQLSRAGCQTSVVPMDGFHLDNRLLSAKGLLARKGAPETFDAEGVLRLVQALKTAPQVYYPTFDRDEDFARAGSAVVEPSCDCVVVEGNYLLFDEPVWRDLAPLWDISVQLDVPMDVLRERLVRRWIDFGLPRDQAVERAEGNDLPNARRVKDHALPATRTFQ